MDKNKVLLRVLVGSRAHGLNSDCSDYDYRGVYVVPTKELLGLNNDVKTTMWIEGESDNTMWEVGHFLKLASKCNPTILEVFVAPVVESTDEGLAMRDLFPYIWNPDDVRNAFVGYAYNQRKKFVEDKDSRWEKYAVAYLRVLYQCAVLFEKNYLPVHVEDNDLKEFLFSVKRKKLSKGQVLDKAEELKKRVEVAYEFFPLKARDNQPDLSKAENYLFSLRRKYWEF